MTSTAGSMYRLVYSRQTVDAAKFTTLLKQESLTFEEVDFSQCSLTSDTVGVVLELCKRCPKLKILKLFKNSLDDKGAESIAEMLGQKPTMEEVHLSHNNFTAAGCRRLVEACEKVRSEKSQPLWLRLEMNSVADADAVGNELAQEYSVCQRKDDVRCTVRSCLNKKKVHIPFFHLQRSATTFVSRAAEKEAQAAAAKARPPAPVRTLSSRSDATPNQASAPRPSAWGGARAMTAPLAEGSPQSQSGYPSLGAKTTQEAMSPEAALKVTAQSDDPKLADVKRPSWKAGSRSSIVLDSFGQRRTMPEQLQKVDPAFVCGLCRFVMVKPVITRCSHLFCQCCFKQWAQQQVELHKSQKTDVGPVPQIRCPAAGCKELLKKADVELLADDGKTSGGQMLQRLRNNLSIRCVHHPEHYVCEFGKDAERVQKEQGISCDWSGAPGAYEEHMEKACPVENYLKSLDGPGADDTTISTDVATNESTRSQYEAEPEPEAVTAMEQSKPELNQDTNQVEKGEEVRVAIFDYTPAPGVEGQIQIFRGDHIKVFKVTETGWAAGVKYREGTRMEDGDIGWFPAGYLAPKEGEDDFASDEEELNT